ncbi:MAG: HU family DNA-binding protein [Gammaproteobacteria bacterium]|nr:HU family DNA-binding protein [Gammaproteobacteria bacterium]
MNKADLIRAAAAKDDSLNQTTVGKSLEAILETVAETLANGDPVQLIGFGTFEVRHRAARTARNPATGETVQVAASSNAAFKAGSKLKARVNG